MKSIIEVFRMNEVDPKTRARIIVKLGEAVNYELGSNVTEPVVFELVTLLDPENDILKDEGFIKLAKK